MKKILISFIVFTFLTFGTVLAAPEASMEISSQIGVLNLNKVAKESPTVKELQSQLNEKAKELSDQLEVDKANFSTEEYKDRQTAAYEEFLKMKQELERKIDVRIKRELEKIAMEKNLAIVLYKSFDVLGGIDITQDVINSPLAIETVPVAPKEQMVNQSILSIGVVDKNRIMNESPIAKELQRQLKEKGKQLSDDLEAAKNNLSSEEFEQKRNEVYGAFEQERQAGENQIEESIKRALEKITMEKNLIIIIDKKSVAFGGIDVTQDVINDME